MRRGHYQQYEICYSQRFNKQIFIPYSQKQSS
jgi:hypothetical protein